MSIEDKFKLKGRCSVVTGGAIGLGRAMAEALAEMGSDIAIMDMNGQAAEGAADEIGRRTGVRTIGLAGDVTDPEDVTSGVDHVVRSSIFRPCRA